MEILLGAFSWLELEQHKEVQHLYDYYIKAHSSVTYLECQKFFLDNENSSGLSSSFFLEAYFLILYLGILYKKEIIFFIACLHCLL